MVVTPLELIETVGNAEINVWLTEGAGMNADVDLMEDQKS